MVQVPLLIGSAKQAIEVWPGVEQLANWTWIQYEKYVTTSLDSFGNNLTESALELYLNPSCLTLDNQTDSSNSSSQMKSASDDLDDPSPESLYASMVSDIRQNCPINDAFRAISVKWKAPVYRYIHTAIPSRPVSRTWPRHCIFQLLVAPDSVRMNFATLGLKQRSASVNQGRSGAT